MQVNRGRIITVQLFFIMINFPFYSRYFFEDDKLYRMKRGLQVDINTGDILIMKKNHPCGSNRFEVLRTGLDFKLKCVKCGHEIMTPRIKITKYIKAVESKAEK